MQEELETLLGKMAEQTRRFVKRCFQIELLGPTKVTGVSEPVSVYEVTGYGLLRTRLQRAAGRGLNEIRW
jgi:class 3 adenylate cyclase